MGLVTEGIPMTITLVGLTCCRVCVNGTSGMARSSEDWCKQFSTGMQIVVSNSELSWKDGVINFDASSAKIYLCPSAERGSINTIELFAGLGGWTQASSSMGVTPIYSW